MDKAERLREEIGGWRRFKQARKDKFRHKYRILSTQIESMKEDLIRLENKKLLQEKLIDSVGPLCDRVIDNCVFLHGEEKVALGKKEAEAILARDASHVIGMFNGLTTVTYSSSSIQIQQQYWCHSWFKALLRKVDKVPDEVYSRQNLYTTLTKIAKSQDQDEIDEAIGMLFLKVL